MVRSPRKLRPSDLVGIVGLFVVLASLFAGWEIRRSVQEDEATAVWPSVDGMSSRLCVEGSGHSYTVKADYTYTVNGQTFYGHRVWAHDFTYSSEQDASEQLKGLEITRPKVYYNPTAPAESVLRTGTGNRRMAMTAPILLLLIGISMIAIFAYSYVKKTNPDQTSSEVL